MYTIIMYYDHLVGVYDEIHNPTPDMCKLLKNYDIYDTELQEELSRTNSLQDLLKIISKYNIPMHIYQGMPNEPLSNWRIEI